MANEWRKSSQKVKKCIDLKQGYAVLPVKVECTENLRPCYKFALK